MKIFLTFDMDWAIDEVIENTLDIIESENVKATFFITHETKVLKRLRDNDNIELGIHPNFNHLITKNVNEHYAQELIEDLKRIVPEAVSVRSHSLFQSSGILDLFKKHDFLFDANLFIPYNSSIQLKPMKHWNGLIRVPHFWEDDVFCIEREKAIYKDWDVSKFLDYKGLKVFDFHPIHVFLNTEHLERYQNAKSHFKDFSQLRNYVNNDHKNGSRVFLRNLIKEAKIRGYCFNKISEVEIENCSDG